MSNDRYKQAGDYENSERSVRNDFFCRAIFLLSPHTI